MVSKILNILLSYRSKKKQKQFLEHQEKVHREFFQNGQISWTAGYEDHKKKSIIESISDRNILEQFAMKRMPLNYGYRLDERIVEYPWIFANLKKERTIFLDAGSTFNFDYILNNKALETKEKYIYTFYPENVSYNSKKISYVYGDLRTLPFKNSLFEEIVCQSTIEHIDMDNSIYGYDLESTTNVALNKSYEYLKVIDELLRVLKNDGQLLLTFPYGKFENHGFFQQLDSEMLEKIIQKMEGLGNYDLTFFKYLPNGWTTTSREDCDDAESFNPHTQKGKKDDFAAHCRGICCIKFNKK